MKRTLAIIMALMLAMMVMPVCTFAAVAPVAENVTLQGTCTINETLTVVYDYHSDSGISAGAPLYQWYVSVNNNGPFELIPGQVSSTFYVSEIYAGRYIQVSVIPQDSKGNIGIESFSVPYKIQVTETRYVNSDFKSAGTDYFLDLSWIPVAPDENGRTYTNATAVGTALHLQKDIPEGSRPSKVIVEAKVKYITLSAVQFNARNESGAEFPSIFGYNGMSNTVFINDVNIPYSDEYCVVTAFIDYDAGKVSYAIDGIMAGSKTITGSKLSYVGCFILQGEGYIDYYKVYTPGKAKTMANNARLTGYSSIGRKLRADFDYYDADGTAAGTHTYMWSSASTENGRYTAIMGETSQEYFVHYSMAGKYIKCTITPYSTSGAGVITETAPVLITGKSTVIADYDFSKEADINDFTGVHENASVTVSDGFAHFDGSRIPGAFWASIMATLNIPAGDTEADAFLLETTCSIPPDGASSIFLGSYSGGALVRVMGNTDVAGYVNLAGVDGTFSSTGNSAAVYTPNSTYKISMLYDISRGCISTMFNDEIKWEENVTLPASGFTALVKVGGLSVDIDSIKLTAFASDAPGVDVASSSIQTGGTDIIGITPNTVIKGCISAHNYIASPSDVTMILVTYEGTVITGLKMETVSVPAGEGYQTVSMTEGLTVPEGTSKIALFVWDDIGNMKPYIKANKVY